MTENTFSMTYTPKTDEEIKQLALDCISDKIFTSQMCRSEEDIPMVFMVLTFTSKEMINQMIELKLSLIYEYYSEAGPRSVNGYPCFLSMKWLNVDDNNRFINKVKEINDALKSL